MTQHSCAWPGRCAAPLRVAAHLAANRLRAGLRRKSFTVHETGATPLGRPYPDADGYEQPRLEPLTSTGRAWLLLGERLGALGLLGAVLLLSAMALIFWTRGAAMADVAAA
jgi:hypothetical protein